MNIHLFPCPIVEYANEQIPEHTLAEIRSTTVFVVERAKTARRYLKSIGHPIPLPDIDLFELDKHDPEKGLYKFLNGLDPYTDLGILSEAGCPGIADPGHRVVTWAHRNGHRVIPHIGPSSILLALMASGMNGQTFVFHGYIPNKRPAIGQYLKKMEQAAKNKNQTQIWIEAPYRNKFVLEEAGRSLESSTILAGCFDLCAPSEEVIVKAIQKWKKIDLEKFHKRPAVFLIGK